MAEAGKASWPHHWLCWALCEARGACEKREQIIEVLCASAAETGPQAGRLFPANELRVLCDLSVPAPTAAPCCSSPSPGGGTLRAGPWQQQNNPAFHLAAAALRRPCHMPMGVGSAASAQAAAAGRVTPTRWRREGRSGAAGELLCSGAHGGRARAVTACSQRSQQFRVQQAPFWAGRTLVLGESVSMLMNPYQNWVPFEQVFCGLEVGSHCPGDGQSDAGLEASSAVTWHRGRAAAAVSMLDVAHKGGDGRAALRRAQGCSSVTFGDGNSSDRPWGMRK